MAEVNYIQELHTNGFTIIPSVIDKGVIDKCLSDIEHNLSFCINDISCDRSSYLTNLSNWQSPSPMLNSIDDVLVPKLSIIIQNFINPYATNLRTNLISRTQYSYHSVPCHQDISYYPENSYAFSSWLALNDVTAESSALEVLPGSHLGKIENPVDFIVPSFIDTIRNSYNWRHHAIHLPVKAGDLIIFDSRLWHGSGINVKRSNRHSIVNRWQLAENTFSCHVAKNQELEFCMWNWLEVSESIIINSLYSLYNIKVLDFTEAISILEDKLITSKLPFLWEQSQAIEALQSLKIVYLGNKYHNAKDPQGIVYRNIWHYLLRYLKTS